MKQLLIMILAALVALLLVTVALAQQATPTPAQEPAAAETPPASVEESAQAVPVTTTETVTVGPRISATATLTATDLDPDAEPFISINLETGAALDPFLVSVNGGGPVDVSGLGGECEGYVAVAPTVSVDWSGDADLVEAFFYSDHDPVLVVQTPSGDFLCNDDANDVLLDPVVEIQAPALGAYRIWVGSFDPGQLLPGLLVLTTNPAVNIGTFDPGALVQREAIPETVVEPSDVRTGEMPTMTAGITNTFTRVALPNLSPESLPITVTLIASGSEPAINLPTGDAVCTGYIGEGAGYAFDWAGDADNLRFFFEGDDDASLLIVGPAQEVYCNDDLVAGENLNPLVDIPNPAAGLYIVSVGRFDMEQDVAGQLTIMAGTTVTPTILAPYQE